MNKSYGADGPPTIVFGFKQIEPERCDVAVRLAKANRQIDNREKIAPHAEIVGSQFGPTD